MKRNILFCILLSLISSVLFAQTPSSRAIYDSTAKSIPKAVPRPKTKAEKKAARKNMTFEQKVEDALHTNVTMPKARVKLPTGQTISSVEDAKKIYNKFSSVDSVKGGLTKFYDANKKYANSTIKSDADKFKNSTLPDLGLKVSEKAKKLKKSLKKDPNKFDGRKFEGLAVVHEYIRQGSGSRSTYIDFYTLNEPNMKPSPYLRDVFWYDMKGNRITNALARDEKTNKIMHGPYKKYVGENLVEEGFYFVGAKHGRWERYDKNFNLTDKELWDKGFLAESSLSYYDEAQTKIKEVVPRLYNKVSGDYFLFNESGTLAQQGKMDDSVKVGVWIEYFPSGNRRKKETQYGKDCYDGTEPFVLREYDEKGKIIYESKEGKRF